LNDFFKTITHKALHKKIKAFVTAMTSCSFLTQAEGQLLRELKIFHPEYYDNSTFKWEPPFIGGNLDTLIGRVQNHAAFITGRGNA
jgi:hypothetical protein